jgi:hypothetical protein
MTCLELAGLIKLSLALKLFIKYVQLQRLSLKKIGEVDSNFIVFSEIVKKRCFTNNQFEVHRKVID